MSGGGPDIFNPPVDEFDVGLSSVSNPTEQEIKVIIEDDTPEKDQGRPRRKEGHQPYDISDDEIAKYDEGVKGRIQKLRFEYHEERRLKEEAGRREMAAIEYARKLVAENSRLTSTLQQGEKTLIEVAKAKTQAGIESAKRDMAEAHASGDADRVADAAARISKYSSEAEALNYQQPSIQGNVPSPEDSVKNFDRQVLQQRTPQGPHPKAIEWYEGNKDWFEKDPVMTKYAKWLDEELIKRGSSPATDAHYSYIDNELRRVFPEKLGDSAPYEQAPAPPPAPVQPRQQQRVSPVSRFANQAPAAPRTVSQVRLTKSEVSIARKLGLSPEQYAEQKMKDYPNG
jgi:hypothetical protein